MAPGVAGTVITVTPSVCAADEPQELFAVTDIVPPAAPAVVVMEVVVELPVQPPGRVHVYPVAPATAAIK